MIPRGSQSFCIARRRFLQALRGPYSARLGFADFFGGGGGGQTPIPGFEHWQYRIPLTINNAQASTLLNVPVLIKLTTARFTYAHAQSAGQDVRVVSNDLSTIYPYQFEAWNDASNNSWIWTSIPSLASGNTTIYLYYGNNNMLDGQKTAAVWNTNYMGVWHLSTVTGGANSVLDSTGNANNGTPTNGPTNATGQIDGAGSFASASNQYIAINNGANFLLPDTLTMEAWYNPTSNSGEQYIFFADDGNHLQGFTVNVGTTLYYYLYADGTTNYRSWKVSYTFSTGSWYHIVVTQTAPNTAPLVYVNGVSQTVTLNSSGGTTSHSAQPLSIARRGGVSSGYVNGLIDEVRLSNIAYSPDLATFQYNSMKDNVITYGAEQSV